MAEPGASVGAGDQAWNISQDEHVRVSFTLRDSEVRAERGERVIPDAWPRGTGDGQQARLTGVRFSDKRSLGDRFQLEVERALFPRLAFLRDARRLLRTRGKVCVAQAPAASAGDHHTVANSQEVRSESIFRTHLSPRRHGEDEVLAGLAMLAGAFAMTAALGSKMATLAEIEQRRHTLFGDQVDAASAATITTVGSAEWHELLAAERHDAVAAIPSLYPDVCFVDVDRHARVENLPLWSGLVTLAVHNLSGCFPSRPTVSRPAALSLVGSANPQPCRV